MITTSRMSSKIYKGSRINLRHATSITIRFIIMDYKDLSRYNEHMYKIILHIAARKRTIIREDGSNLQLSSLTGQRRI